MDARCGELGKQRAQLQEIKLHKMASLARFGRAVAYSTRAQLEQTLAGHYHSLEPEVPLRAHAQLATQHLKWLERHARSQGYGNGNWQTILARSVDDLVSLDKPLAYVLGTQPFHPLQVDLVVRPPILVPRPETEHWVLHLSETILSSFSSSSSSSSPCPTPFRILDIGTGSGCIALALSESLQKHSTLLEVETIAVDQSTLAVELARENVDRCDLSSSVSVHHLDLFEPSFVDNVRHIGTARQRGEGFDLVVSNPPYVTRREFRKLDRSVREWEDRRALVGEHPGTTFDRDDDSGEVAANDDDNDDNDDGLVFYRKMIDLLDRLLRGGTDEQGHRGATRARLSSSSSSSSSLPNVAFEVGKGQASRVGDLLRAKGYKAEIVSDPWGVERAVFGWRR